MARPGDPARHEVLVQIPRARVGELIHGDIEEGYVDVAPLARLPGTKNAGENGCGRRGAGHVVDHRKPEPGRRPLRLAGQGKEARLRLHQVVESGPRATLAFPSVGRDMGADDPRVGRREIRIGQAQLARLVAAQVVHEGIRRRNEPMQHRLSVGVLEIEGQRALVAVEGLEDMRVLLAQVVRPQRAAGIAALGGVLDLDHVGAEIREVARGVRAGSPVFGGDDAQPFERKRHTGFLATSCRAMIIRCISLVPSPMHKSGASR